jgi:hypothetical protein
MAQAPSSGAVINVASLCRATPRVKRDRSLQRTRSRQAAGPAKLGAADAISCGSPEPSNRSNNDEHSAAP